MHLVAIKTLRTFQDLRVLSSNPCMGRLRSWGVTRTMSGRATTLCGMTLWQIVKLIPVGMAQMVKNLPAMRETQVRSLGWEKPPGEGKGNHSSILAWRIPWIKEPGRLKSIGSQRVRHDWTTTLSFFLLWRNRILPSLRFTFKCIKLSRWLDQSLALYSIDVKRWAVFHVWLG